LPWAKHRLGNGPRASTFGTDGAFYDPGSLFEELEDNLAFAYWATRLYGRCRLARLKTAIWYDFRNNVTILQRSLEGVPRYSECRVYRRKSKFQGPRSSSNAPARARVLSLSFWWFSELGHYLETGVESLGF